MPVSCVKLLLRYFLTYISSSLSPLSKTVRFNVLKIQKKAKDANAKQFAKF